MELNTTSRYSDEDLQFFDEIVTKKLEEAKEQLDYYMQQISEFGDNEESKVRNLEDSFSTVEQERMFSLASRQKNLIQNLENAKLRIKNKVYGICRETGKLISKERLVAVPHATLSIEAKQKS